VNGAMASFDIAASSGARFFPEHFPIEEMILK
jgi:hypothetical protein